MGKISLYLECELTEDEVQQRFKDLKNAELQRGKADDDLALATDDWKRRKATLESAVSTAAASCRELAQTLKTGHEMRNVECLTEVKPPHHLTIRLDTGEVIRTRAATMEELQLALDMIPETTEAIHEECVCGPGVISVACPKHGKPTVN